MLLLADLNSSQLVEVVFDENNLQSEIFGTETKIYMDISNNTVKSILII